MPDQHTSATPGELATEKQDAPEHAFSQPPASSSDATPQDDETASPADPDMAKDGDGKDQPIPPRKWNNIARILSYSTRLDKFLMIIALIFSAAAGVALPLMNLIFSHLVTSFNGYFIPGSNVTKAEFLHGVDRNALFLVYLFIAKFLLSYISIYAFRMTGIRISAAIRVAYLTALFNQPISSIDKLPPGAATDALTRVTNTIQVAISDKLGLMIQALATVIAAMILAFTHSWSLTLVSSSVVVVMFAFFGFIVPPFIKIEKAVIKTDSSASAVAGEVLKAVRTVKSLCAENSIIAKYAGWNARSKELGLKKSPLAAGQFAPLFFFTYADMALTFWAGVRFYSLGWIASVGTVTLVLFSVLLVVGTAGSLVGPCINIMKAISAAPLCFKIIDAQQLNAGGLKEPEAQATSEIRFEDVRFTYPSRPRAEILKGLNLTVPAGKITALVGPSGCGKSTTVALLERWYELSEVNEAFSKEKEKKDSEEKSAAETKAEKKKEKKAAKKNKAIEETTPVESESDEKHSDTGPIFQNSGRISVGPHNIEALDRKWWRSQIGLVQQEPFLFDETIYENISRGLIGSPWENDPIAKKEQLVEEACNEAFADEFIRRLPDGYKTNVGESGMKLSGGQRQRLAIARSIIKKPQILILDEATSSVDVHSERIVEAALDRASKNRTTITIAHRLSTIKKADHIVVIKEGAAVEEGTHDELMTREDGLYHNLVRAQHLELGGAEDGRDEELEKAVMSGVEENVLGRSKSMVSELGKADLDPSSAPSAVYKARGLMTTVGRFLYEQRQHRVLHALIILSAIGGGVGYAIQAYLFSHLIVVFQYTGAKLVKAGDFWSLMFFVLSLAVAVCYGVIGWCTSSLSVHVSTAYRQEYFENILTKPVAWFDEEDHSSGTLTSRLSNDPHQLEEILGPNMALPLVAIFNLMGCSIISFVFGWKLALVVFFAALPVILAASFLRLRFETQYEAMNAKVFAESSKFAADSIGAFRTVASLTLEESIINRFRALVDEQVDQAFKKGRYATLVFALSGSLELCAMALAFWYGGQLLGSHEYNVMQFFIVYIAIVQGGQAAGQFLAFGPNIAQATAASNRILAFRGKPEVTDEPSKTSDASTLKSEDGVAIEFRDVGFTYPTREIPIYRHLSVTINRGDYIAFVGPSGCGKTTIISLLERFYSISSGQILIDGVETTQVPLGGYRNVCALVSQEPILFQGTVRENLTLGLPYEASQQEVEQACKAAEIYDFITSLSQSFDTPLSAGTHSSLSGGQKQRLCIARALLRKPRLLLLDEATSSLDSQSEGLVQKAIENVAQSSKVTIVVVAHRLATVQNAGRIVVLGAGGRILEEGKHVELLQKRGVYWGMCKAQALDR